MGILYRSESCPHRLHWNASSYSYLYFKIKLFDFPSGPCTINYEKTMLDVAVLIHHRRDYQHIIIIIIFSNLNMNLSGIQMHYCSLIIELWQPIMTHRTNIRSHSVSNQKTAGLIELATILPALLLSHTAQRPYHMYMYLTSCLNDNLKRRTEWSIQGEKEQGHWANMHLVYWNVGYKEGETARWKHVTFHTFWIIR
jgi:hypothetical protein